MRSIQFNLRALFEASLGLDVVQDLGPRAPIHPGPRARTRKLPAGHRSPEGRALALSWPPRWTPERYPTEVMNSIVRHRCAILTRHLQGEFNWSGRAERSATRISPSSGPPSGRRKAAPWGPLWIRRACAACRHFPVPARHPGGRFPEAGRRDFRGDLRSDERRILLESAISAHGRHKLALDRGVCGAIQNYPNCQLHNGLGHTLKGGPRLALVLNYQSTPLVQILRRPAELDSAMTAATKEWYASPILRPGRWR